MFYKLKSHKNKKPQRLQGLLKTLLSLSLVLSTTAQAEVTSSEPYWLFPGETLPGEKAVLPMTVGAGNQYDINLKKRDWFLLKPVEAVYGFQAGKNSGDSLGYQGPRLNSYNAQMYYRLVAGMVLKESLEQMGVSSFEARRFFDGAAEKGLDFDKTPLNKLGKLPTVLDNLYINFNRPSAKHALLPYLMAPLSIAEHQSDFRHFLETDTDSEFADRCVDLNSYAPMVWIQDELSRQKTEIETLDRDYQDAVSLLKKSNLQSVKLTADLRTVTEEVNLKTQCLNSLKNQVNKGSNQVSQACLETAAEVVEGLSSAQTWLKFTEVSLANVEGDFVSMQNSKAALGEIENQILSLEQQELAEAFKKEEVESSLAASENSLKILKEELLKQNKVFEDLGTDYETAKTELTKLQKLSFDLDQGAFQETKTQEDLAKAIEETPVREQKISELKSHLPTLLEKKALVQKLQATLDTQINFLSQQMETYKIQLKSLEQADLIKTDKSLETLTSELETQKKVLRQATDAFRFSEYILSLISKNLFEVEKNKNETANQLEQEKTAALNYALKVQELELLRSDELPLKQAAYEELKTKAGAYTSDDQMGWYLQAACSEAQGSSVFLSRESLENEAEQSSADGKWGLFNLDYKNYKNSLDSGVALNLKAYVNLSVRNIISHLDFMNQTLYSSDLNCSQLNNDPNQYAKDQIVGAFSMWTGGSANTEVNPGFCKLDSASSVEFKKTLEQTINYEGSLLDQALPKVGVHNPKITMEREAFFWLTNEFQALNRSQGTYSLEERREGLIKSLIKVLANDYVQEFKEENSGGESKRKVLIAEEAPGAELYRKADLPIDSVHSVKTIGQVDLYSAPIKDAQYKTDVSLSLNDEVKILPLSVDFPEESVKAAWVRVEVVSKRFPDLAGQAYWMPAWPITYKDLVSADGEPIYKSINDVNCPMKKLVSDLNNFKNSDKYVTRFLPEITTSKYGSDAWQMSWRGNEKTSPAYTDQGPYVACELFQVDGQNAAELDLESPFRNLSDVDYSKVQGIRIIKVETVTDVNGKIYYVPLENYGGFVHSWIYSRNRERPRILLGEALGSDWSKVQ